jgi:pimeloyl-ACP methyl ester carboxylesterase
MRAMRRLAAPAALVLLLSSLFAAPAAAGPRADATAGAATPVPTVVRSEPCPDSIFTCITIRVPRDHFTGGGPTFDVTFGLLRATRQPRKGVFVTVTGGPGTSGLAAADGYTAAFDPRIPRNFDIVFLDQRGVGASEPLQCPQAALAFYSSTHVPTVSRSEAEAFAADAGRFSDDCIAETGVDPAGLAFYSTRQAVEDLDAFRAWLGADTIDLYGESYGTQYAQTYAAAHPDRLHSLMIDGPVDLTLTGLEYYDEDARAFGTVLARTLNRCTDTRACRRDVAGHDALDGYDDLAAHLGRSPIAFPFVRADGTRETRELTLSDLETAAAGYVYGEFDRMTLQRAIAWASRGEVLPLARLTYLSLGVDPETLAVIPDPTWSDAMFYAVECMDYAYGSGSPADRVDTYLKAGEAAGVAGVRLGSVFYGDLPCAHWPVHPASAARPAYLTETPFPVFVLASTWDPATPYAGAVRIRDQLADAYFIVQPGGPHIIFGRGNACPDDLITAFLVRGQRPDERRTRCPATGVDPYVPIPLERVTGYRGALDAMTAIDDELNNSADYWAWDGVEPLAYGCLFGGTVRYRPFADGFRIQLRDCAFTSGLALTGRATIDTTEGTFTMRVSAPGGTRLTYSRDADGDRHISGSYFGTPAS